MAALRTCAFTSRDSLLPYLFFFLFSSRSEASVTVGGTNDNNDQNIWGITGYNHDMTEARCNGGLRKFATTWCTLTCTDIAQYRACGISPPSKSDRRGRDRTRDSVQQPSTVNAFANIGFGAWSRVHPVFIVFNRRLNIYTTIFSTCLARAFFFYSCIYRHIYFCTWRHVASTARHTLLVPM